MNPDSIGAGNGTSEVIIPERVAPKRVVFNSPTGPVGLPDATGAARPGSPRGGSGRLAETPMAARACQYEECRGVK